MLQKNWNFIKEKEIQVEQVLGRQHFWLTHPEITKNAKTLMVKVVMPVGGYHHFHRHPEMNEILYILKGTAEQWVEDEKQILQAGDAVYIDPNVVHATFNHSDEELVFLAVLAPNEGWEAGTIDEYENHPYATYKKTMP